MCKFEITTEKQAEAVASLVRTLLLILISIPRFGFRGESRSAIAMYKRNLV